MNYLEICAGIGGFSRGFEMAGVGWTPAAFCEIEPFARSRLAQRFPGVPVAIAGGIPCQPWSVAGRRRGFQDERDLWRPTRRLIYEIQPDCVFLENTSNFGKMALDRVSFDLEGLGYEVGPVDIPAGGVEAWHARQRCFVVAYLKSQPRRAGAEPDTRAGRR